MAAALTAAAFLILLLVEGGAFRPEQAVSRPDPDPNTYDQEYFAKVSAAMDTLRGEAETCAKELELLIPKHERLLNAVREAVLDLPEKGVAFNGSYDSYWLYPSTVRELAGQAPELVELLDEMRNVGLEWEELRAFPTGERQSVSFTVLRDGGFGGSHMCVDLCSPPPELSPSYYMGIIEVTGKWGIYWTVNSMAGR